MRVAGFLSRAAARHPRRTTVIGALVVALSVLTGLVAWAVSSPFGTTPDDDYHIISAYCPDPGSEECPIVGYNEAGRPLVDVPQDILARMCYWAGPDVSGSCVGWAGPDVRMTTDRVNIGEYPGYYYDVMHMFRSDDINRMELNIRLFNCGIAAVIVFFLLVLLEPVGRRVYVWTVAATAVPMVPCFVASVAPDSWSFVGVTTAFAATYGMMLADGRWRRIGLSAMAVLGVAMSAAARSDAAGMAVLAVLAVCLVHWRRFAGRQQLAARRGTVVMVLVLVVLGILGALGGRQSNNAVTSGLGAMGDPEASRLRVLVNNVVYLPEWISYMWWRGNLGTDHPQVMGALLFVGTVVMVWVGVFRGGLTWAKGLALAAAAGAFVGAPLVVLRSVSLFPNWVATGLQFRYLVPMLIVLVGVALLPVKGKTLHYLSTRAAVSFWLMLVVVQSVNLHSWIRRWVTGRDIIGVNLSASADWWRDIPLSPNAVWVVGSLGLAVAAAAVVAVRWQPGADEPSRPVDAGSVEAAGSAEDSAERAREPRESDEAAATGTVVGAAADDGAGQADRREV